MNQFAVAANPVFSGIEKIGKKLGLANHADTPANENPGALAGATGAKVDSICHASQNYLTAAARAMALRDAIRECDTTDAALIMSNALDQMRLGAPIPPLMNAMDEARSWAEWATPFEIKAYALACYNAMSPKDQAGFLAYVLGRAAA